MTRTAFVFGLLSLFVASSAFAETRRHTLVIGNNRPFPGKTSGRYAMSASQLRTWGSALVVPGAVCGLMLNRYDAKYFGRSDVRDAVQVLGDKAAARAASSCRSGS